MNFIKNKRLTGKKTVCILLAVCTFLFAMPFSARAASGPVSVGYYAGWAAYRGYSPDRILADELTHIHYAFAGIDPSGRSLMLTDPENDLKNFQALRKLKQKYPHLRLLISVGGWDNSTYFSRAAVSRSNREAFAQSCLDFILEYGFDGVDLDWEYPVSGGMPGNENRPQDRENFTLLLQAIRNKLDGQGRKDGQSYLLTIAGGGDSSYLNKIEPKKISSLVDYIFLMAYDYHGPWDRYTDLNAPLFTPEEASPQYKGSVSYSVQSYLEKGVPAQKLVLGMPFYGHLYQGVKDFGTGLYNAFSSCQSLSYWEISNTFLKNPSYCKYRHSEAQVPYVAEKNFFLSYENPQSIAAKTLFAKSQGLLGFGAWELSQDENSILFRSAVRAWKSSLPFSDVLPGDWYYESVSFLWKQGIMNGTSNLVFSPGSELKRGMLVQILYNLEGRPDSFGDMFLDVPSTAWYADAVNWAASVGLVSGYGNGKFGPGDSVTREQMVTVLQRYARSKGYMANGNIESLYSSFPDAGAVSSWAVEAMSWAVEQDLLKGKSGKLFPNSRAFRSEAAALLERFLKAFS